MPAKQLEYSEDARRALKRVSTRWPMLSRSPSVPRAATWSRQEVRPATITNDGVTIAKRSSSRSFENMARNCSRKPPRRPTTSRRRHHDRHRPRQAIVNEGFKNVTPGQSAAPERGIERGVQAIVDNSSNVDAGRRPDQDRSGRGHLGC